MPDRLSELLHEFDTLSTGLPEADDVRRRGLRLRHRRQVAAGGGALALVALVAVGVASLGGGAARLEPAPAVPATSVPEPAPTPAVDRPAEPTAPPSVTDPAATPTPATAPPAEVETYESEVGYLRGFGERDGARTVLIDRVQLVQGPGVAAEARRRGVADPGPEGTVLGNDNNRVREHLLSPDVSVAVAGSADRRPRGSGTLTEVGDPAALADLERAFAALEEGEQLLLDVVFDGDRVVSLVELELQ